MTASIPSLAEEIYLTPPGLRPIKDPSLVIPAGYHYPNTPAEIPAYRGADGNPVDGWSKKFVRIRRFVSNQSAWIYYRNSDLKQSAATPDDPGKEALRFWPVGTTLVIESYRGTALQRRKDKLIQVDVMMKIDDGRVSSGQTFYPANWTYARYNPDGTPAITSATVRECHQCHSIAFHLTGDLVFTTFP